MIDIKYSDKEIKVEVNEMPKIFGTPLTMLVSSSVTGKEKFTCELNSFTWGTFPISEMNDVIIKNIKGNILLYRKWNVLIDGSYLYKSLYLYCKNLFENGYVPKGLAVGTHDGAFGEWVPAVREKMSKAFLIEASNKQFNELCKNYKDFSNVKLYEKLITVDGKDVKFFEGGRGYTNSIVERVIRGQEIEKIHSRISPSTSLNDFIVKEMDGKIDWLHLDVEGLDAKLLMSMDNKLYTLPKLIIFEHENLESIEKKDLENFFDNNGYSVIYKNVSALAIRKK
jgi:hypothetical protein